MCRPAVRLLTRADTAAALELYTDLTLGPPACDQPAFHKVLEHPGTTVTGAFEGDVLISMVTLHLLPNVTWDARPYALIENVVTRADRRGQGFGRLTMEAALERAWTADAYKVMLLTGQRRDVKGFYEAVGFSSEDKHAMVIRRS